MAHSGNFGAADDFQQLRRCNENLTAVNNDDVYNNESEDQIMSIEM